MGSSTSSMSAPQPTYSGVPAATVEGPYSPADVSANRNSNAFSQENIRSGASAYYSAQIPGPNSISHGNTGDPPYPQYGATVPGTERFYH